MSALKRIAALVDDDLPTPGFHDPQAFAEWVTKMADATAAQVLAVKTTFPPDCTNRDAPSQPR